MDPIEINDVFDLAFRFVTETAENIFLTGKAGTGKTTFLKYLKAHTTKNIVVAAPTGVAAINAGGVTLHSLLQLPFQPYLPTGPSRHELVSKVHFGKNKIELLRKMDLLVIDEISMVRCDVMDAIDALLKHVRGNHLAFGGVQVLFIGDLHQLSPVAQNHEWKILSEYYSSPYFFDSIVVKENTPLLIELTKIYRQKEASFVDLLNKVRNNVMTPDDFRSLHGRLFPGFRPEKEEGYITLTTHNNQSELINRVQLQRLPTESFTYNAIIEKDFPEQFYPADAELILKEGAQVMFLKNDNSGEKRYFNGKIGIIKTLEEKSVIVECDGDPIKVGPETWENSRYTLNRADGKLEQEVLGTFTQYPLRLAWAITIHKSQGLTFEKVMIDAAAAFSSGQVYVALSRCTSLEGIVLLSKIPSSAIYNDVTVLNVQKKLVHKGPLEDRFTTARLIFTQDVLEQLFAFKQISEAAHTLYNVISAHRTRLNAGIDDWIKNLVQRINEDHKVGMKFVSTLSALLKEEPIIEKNNALKQRVSDAANHFLPKFSSYLDSIEHHPLLCEHVDASSALNESLAGLFLKLHACLHELQYCHAKFSLSGYLRNRLQYLRPRIQLNCYAIGKQDTTNGEENAELFQMLRKWRDRICAETGMAIYLIAGQNTLKEIAQLLPQNAVDLLKITGFGKAKVDRYGDEIIEMVGQYCTRYGLETKMHLKTASKRERKAKPARSVGDSRKRTFDLYKQGFSIEAIAKERNFAVTTIEEHLTHFIQSGDLELKLFVDEERAQKIREATNVHGITSAKTIFQNLPEGFTYGEIKMVLAFMEREASGNSEVVN